MQTIDSDHSGLLVKLLAKGVIGNGHKSHLEVNYIIVLSCCDSQIFTSHEFRLLNYMQVSSLVVLGTGTGTGT